MLQSFETERYAVKACNKRRFAGIKLKGDDMLLAVEGPDYASLCTIVDRFAKTNSLDAAVHEFYVNFSVKAGPRP